MGIRHNFVYNSILTVSNYLFPLITYPYISRVLGPINLGAFNFIDSIINYYILFSMMGIGTIAIREIAKTKESPKEMTKVFSSLFVLNSISTFIVLIILFISVSAIPKLYEHKDLMYIGAIKLIFNYLLIEWFFKGIENFKYITQRSIIIKSFYVIAVFVFIRDSQDYKICYLLSVIMIVLNAILNIFYSRRFVVFSFKNIDFKPYVRSFFVLGIYGLLISMYTSFNVAYLGFVSNEAEVGYYTTATKLYSILLSLFTAFTTVMLPRMSFLVSEGKYTEFKRLTEKSKDVLFAIAMPLIVIAIVFAPDIVFLLSGSGYEPAILPMRIIMPLIFIIGYEQIVIIQILMPLKKDKAILINSALGALIGGLMNFLLVSKLGSVGSSIVWVCSEVVVLSSSQYFVRKYIGYQFPYRKVVQNILYSVPIITICYIISLLNFSSFYALSIGIFLVGVYYLIVGYIFLKNELIIDIVQRIRIKFYK